MQIFRSQARLAPPERQIARSAAILLPLLRACMAVCGFDRTRRILQCLGAGGAHATDRPESEALRLAAIVAAVARHLPLRTTCLARSLTTWYLLRRRGMPAELRIGARKHDDAVEAHAWVEYRGVALDDPEQLASYATFTAAVLPLPK